MFAVDVACSMINPVDELNFKNAGKAGPKPPLVTQYIIDLDWIDFSKSMESGNCDGLGYATLLFYNYLNLLVYSTGAAKLAIVDPI